MPKQLPTNPSLENLKNQAKALLKAHREGLSEANSRIQKFHPGWSRHSVAEIQREGISLSDAQWVIAREYGFYSWAKLKRHVEAQKPITTTLIDVIREAIGKSEGAITEGDLQSITELKAPDNNIRDITGIEKCVNLKMLMLYENQISDVAPLSSLSHLTELWLRVNQISDVSALSSLTNLTLLNLGDNQISDVTPLSNLTNLTLLNLAYNQITDPSPLAKLTNLEHLYLRDNSISDLAFLFDLTNLTSLFLDGNQITDLAPLAKLTNLEQLFLGGPTWRNSISDITPLVENKGLSEGDRVNLEGNPLNDEAYDVHIPALEKRGVKVSFDPK